MVKVIQENKTYRAINLKSQALLKQIFKLELLALRAIFWNIGIFKRTMAASIPATSAAF